MIVRLIASMLLTASLAAAPASQATTRRAVGQVLGKTIYDVDLGITEPIPPGLQFDARDAQRWGQMKEVSDAFGGPIIERFKKDSDVGATEQERLAFARVMHASQVAELPKVEKQIETLQEQLADATLSPEARKEVEHKLTLRKLDRDHKRQTIADGPDSWAKGSDPFIEAGKLQRNLYRKYGGRIIFQQFGPEALDGMRRLFEDAEKAGDLRIDDPGLRHLFYHYYNMRHSELDDPTILEKPWFLRDPTTQPRD